MDFTNRPRKWGIGFLLESTEPGHGRGVVCDFGLVDVAQFSSARPTLETSGAHGGRSGTRITPSLASAATRTNRKSSLRIMERVVYKQDIFFLNAAIKIITTNTNIDHILAVKSKYSPFLLFLLPNHFLTPSQGNQKSSWAAPQLYLGSFYLLMAFLAATRFSQAKNSHSS